MRRAREVATPAAAAFSDRARPVASIVAGTGALGYGLQMDFGWADIFSLHALIAAVGWGIACIMTIHHLHIADPNRLRSILYIVVGIIVTGAVLIEGAQEHKNSHRLDENISEIRKAVSVPQATPDQVLAAAASKLLSQGKEIEALNSSIEKLQHPPPESDALYQDGHVVARVVNPSIDEGNKTVHFDNITEAGRLTASKSFEFRGMLLAIIRLSGMFGAPGHESNYNDVTCRIIDR